MSFFKTLCFSFLFFTISFNQAGRAEGSTPTVTTADAYASGPDQASQTHILYPICNESLTFSTNVKAVTPVKPSPGRNSTQIRQDLQSKAPPLPLTVVMDNHFGPDAEDTGSAFRNFHQLPKRDQSLLYTPVKGSIRNHPSTRPLRTLSIDPTFTSGGDTDIDSDMAVIKKSNTLESVQSRNSVSQTPSLTIRIPTPGPLSARSQSRQGHNSINGQVNSSDVHQPDAYEAIRPILVTLQYILLTTALLVFISVILYSIYYIRLIREIYEQKEFVVE